MLLNLKIRTYFITLILILSSLSLLIIPSEKVKADEDDIQDFLLQLTGLHPFITAGVYQYSGNKTLEINGDIIFNLYYASTLVTQGKYKDDLKVTLYAGDLLSILGMEEPPKEKGNATITLKPELFGETVQNCTVKLENISINLTVGDLLIFTVEIIQSGKPIGNIIEKRYEDKLKSRIQKVGEFLNKSSEENLKEIGSAVLEILGITEELGISSDEIASLADSLISSSFVYNSKDYPSSVTIPTSSTDKLTLYFHYITEDEYSESEFPVDMIEKPSNGTAMTWPTTIFSLDPEGGFNIENWFIWFSSSWLVYITSELPPEEEDENIITYYLTGDNKLVTVEPEGFSPSRISLKDPKKWEGPSLERNRIIKNVTAELYLHFPRIIFLKKVNVNVSLYEDGNLIASYGKNLNRITLLELLTRGPGSPTIFTFEDAKEKEIWNGHNISLQVSISGGPLFSLRPVFLLCGSKDYPSSIIFNFNETDNIKMEIEKGAEKDPVPVIPGGSAEFILEISSKYKDTIKIDAIPKDPNDLNEWSIENTESIDIAANGSAQVHVIVKSEDNSINAEDDNIQLTISATGLTGKASKDVNIEVSKEAVEYNIIVTTPSDKDIKHGTKGIYTFKIKNNNTGVWPDSYEIKVSSEHDWANTSYKKEDVTDIKIGEEFKVDVTVTVPWYTDITSDKLTFKVISKESNKEYSVSVNVTTTVINPNIFENVYHFFESAAEDTGLDEVLGSYAAAFLIFIIVFFILIFLILVVYLIKKKFVEIICLERIKDITSDEEAKFDITLQNPSKQTLTYEISTEKESKNWDVSLDKERVMVEPKQSSIIFLTVKPTDYIKSDEWIEVKLLVKVVERKKLVKISIVTTMKDGKSELQITGLVHWPRVFKKGERVETSFRLNNKGNTSANNINVILYINGEEKNKVEDITIPRGGYAEIEIPWIAVKGKNEINILVK